MVRSDAAELRAVVAAGQTSVAVRIAAAAARRFVETPPDPFAATTVTTQQEAIAHEAPVAAVPSHVAEASAVAASAPAASVESGWQRALEPHPHQGRRQISLV